MTQKEKAQLKQAMRNIKRAAWQRRYDATYYRAKELKKCATQ